MSDWLSYRDPVVHRWTAPREQGVDAPALVRRAMMEGDGVITVIRK